MDRIINVKVGGNYISKDNKNAGVRGEANVTLLRITFDEGWREFTKTITFFDAHGKNPVQRTQGIDMIEDITSNLLTYITPIPAEPLAIAGEMTFVIEGYYDGKRQRSIEDRLVVKDSPDTSNAADPNDPTPTKAEELQSQIDYMLGEIQNAVFAKDSAVVASQLAESSALRAMERAGDAEYAAYLAEQSAGKTSYIGDNGNWYEWDKETASFYDTGIKAQAGSTVYVGDNPPAEADVWVDPDGEDATCAPYIGANGNWYTWNGAAQAFVDSGVKAQGEKPVKGTDYWTAQDKDEIAQYLKDTHVSISSYSADMSAFAYRLTLAETEVSNVKKDVSATVHDITILQQQVAEYGQWHVNHFDRIAALEALGADFSVLSGRVSTVESNVSNVMKDVGAMVGDITILQKDVGDIEIALDRILEMQNELIGGGA